MGRVDTVVRREDIARVCSDVAKVPLERLLLDDAARFLEMEDFLKTRVIGHQDNIDVVAESLRRNYAGFSHARPLGSFLFLGSSGVGKTELAKALADFLFGADDALIRFDMSELSESHSVSRLIGAPPGYVGHGEGGQLSEAIRARPHAVVLFDEVEKAHPDVIPVLLQILDEGRLTDSKGRTVTFRHAVVVMTSNLGAEALHTPKRRVGFGASDDDGAPNLDGVIEAAKGHFPPELFGRIEDKLVFAPLSMREHAQVAGLLLKSSAQSLKTSRNIGLTWTDDVLAHLVEQGALDKTTGARPLRQVIQRLVESPVSAAILKQAVHEGDVVDLQLKSGAITLKRAPAPE